MACSFAMGIFSLVAHSRTIFRRVFARAIAAEGLKPRIAKLMSSAKMIGTATFPGSFLRHSSSHLMISSSITIFQSRGLRQEPWGRPRWSAPVAEVHPFSETTICLLLRKEPIQHVSRSMLGILRSCRITAAGDTFPKAFLASIETRRVWSCVCPLSVCFAPRPLAFL